MLKGHHYFFFFFFLLRHINNKHPVVFYGTVFPVPVTGKSLINQKPPFHLRDNTDTQQDDD